MYGVDPPAEIYTYHTQRQYFRMTLDKIAGRLTKHKKLVILFDGLDYLTSEFGAQSLSWLPDSWPKHVHVVLTTDSADGPVMRNLGNHVNSIVRSWSLDASIADGCFLQIDSLSLDEIEAIIDNELTRSSRALNPAQWRVRALHILTSTYLLLLLLLLVAYCSGTG